MRHFCTLTCLLFLGFSITAQTPPATWQEHWFEHDQLLTRMFYDSDVAVYYDDDVDTSVTWPFSFMGDVWRYVKSVYGSFGSDPHLFAVFHTDKYSGGHPSTYFDASHDYRNVIDVGPYTWTSGTGGDLDIPTHEVGHIVEGASKGIHGSPAFPIWGDSKWAEIFIYDVYLGLGETSEASRWYTQMQSTTDDFPVAGTHWFRDWFYPIYNNYGGTTVLNNFFEYLADYFPQSSGSYSRDMNWGEFIHFWSGAAGVSLKPLATSAFGWSTTFNTQFQQARSDFPFAYGTGVAYIYKDCNYGGYVTALQEGNYTLSQLQDMGVVNDDISSLKVSAGYEVQLYNNDNFGGSTITVSSDDNCLVNEGFNDIVSSLKVVSTGARRAQPTGITDSASVITFKVVPNPVMHQLQLLTPVSMTGGVITVLDMSGREVLRRSSSIHVIDVSMLTSGVYILKLTGGGETLIRRFVKQ